MHIIRPDSVHHPAAPEPATPLPTKPALTAPNPCTRSNAPNASPNPRRNQPSRSRLPISTPVRSLRKSEQVPVLARPEKPSPDSKIPFHRHSDEEIAAIRRRDALALMTAAAEPQTRGRPLRPVDPRLPLAIAGAACFFFYEFPMVATAACAAIALVISAFVFVRRPSPATTRASSP